MSSWKMVKKWIKSVLDFRKLKNIIIGFWNLMRNNNKEISEQRIDICNSCKNKIQLYGEDFCNICGCLIESKTRVNNEKCPIEKW